MNNWKHILTQLKHRHLQETAPGFYKASGSTTYKVKPYTDKKANGFAHCITDWITFHGGTASRINTAGTMRKINGQMKWTHSGARAGTADIH